MDNRTIEEVRENETKLIDEIDRLEKVNNSLRGAIKVHSKKSKHRHQAILFLLKKINRIERGKKDIHRIIASLQKENMQLKSENMQLNDNWNELEEYINNRLNHNFKKEQSKIAFHIILNKIQEIKEGKNEC